MHVPEPVISYAVKPKNPQQSANFGKALNRFQREDPTFRVHVDNESGETIISGMGELHLDIYVERMRVSYSPFLHSLCHHRLIKGVPILAERVQGRC